MRRDKIHPKTNVGKRAQEQRKQIYRALTQTCEEGSITAGNYSLLPHSHNPKTSTHKTFEVLNTRKAFLHVPRNCFKVCFMSANPGGNSGEALQLILRKSYVKKLPMFTRDPFEEFGIVPPYSSEQNQSSRKKRRFFCWIVYVGAS